MADNNNMYRSSDDKFLAGQVFTMNLTQPELIQLLLLLAVLFIIIWNFLRGRF